MRRNLQEAERNIAQLRHQVRALTEQNQSIQSTVNWILSSRAWRLSSTVWKVTRMLRKRRGDANPFGALVSENVRTSGEGSTAAYTSGQVVKTDAPVNPGDLTYAYFDHLRRQTQDRADEYVPLSTSGDFDFSQSKVKLIAFYLPQFHPIPENDEWWGKGFTEWTNVSRGIPQFAGHYQPHLPDELGFYDLRIVETQKRQIELAKKYGIYGFCYYYYWFGGKTLLTRPLEQVMANSDLDLPFCLCWANENWTRRWDGLDQEVLIAQSHGAEDGLRFIRSIEPYLRDPRYIKINGRPLLMIYRPGLIPNFAATVSQWRDYCKENSIGDPFLVMAQGFGDTDPRPYDLDGAVEFPPLILDDRLSPINHELSFINPEYQGTVYDYSQLVECQRDFTPPPYKLFKTVFPGWDNEARRPGRSLIFANSSPDWYGKWLAAACDFALTQQDNDGRIVFINAWNEWAEGAHLEPDRKYGYAYLQATRDCLDNLGGQPAQVERRPTSEPAENPDGPADVVSPDLAAASEVKTANSRSGLLAKAFSWFGARQYSKSVNSTRNKIVVVSHDALTHGAQLICLNLIKVLRQHFNYDVHCILLGEGPLESEIARFAEVHRFYSDIVSDRNRLDVLNHLYDSGARIAICNTVASGRIIPLVKKAGFSVVSLIHELPSIINAAGLIDYATNIAMLSDKLVFPAQYVKERFIDLLKHVNGQIEVAPQGLYNKQIIEKSRSVDKARFREEIGLPPETKIVLGVGYGDSRKGVDLFVQVAHKTCAKMPDAHFVWLGAVQGELKHWLQHDVEALGIESNLVFLPSRKDVEEVYLSADAFLLTSREDPFPSVVLEAMSASLPVIAFERSGGITEILRDESGVLVPYLDTDSMSRHLCDILGDEERAKTIGRNAARMVKESFSFLDYVYRLLEIAGARFHKVSVIVPNYNHAGFLGKRLASILNQTYPIYEIIFLDDNSQDDSVRTAEEFLKQSKTEYRIVTSQSNSGSPFRQWKRGIEQARGDLVWIAESDDHCENELLSNLAPAFDDPDVTLAYCQSAPIDENDNLSAGDYLFYTNGISPTKWLRGFVRDGKDELFDTLLIKNTIINASAVVIRKQSLALDDNLLAAYRFCGDWAAYVGCLSKGKISFTPRVLNYHRRHAGTVTGTIDADRFLSENLTVKHSILNVVKNHPLPVSSTAESSQIVINSINQSLRDFFYLSARRGGDISETSPASQCAELWGAFREFLQTGQNGKRILIITSDLEVETASIDSLKIANHWASNHTVYLCNARPAKLNKVSLDLLPQHFLSLEGNISNNHYASFTQPSEYGLCEVEERLAVLKEMMKILEIEIVLSQGWWADRFAFKLIKDLNIDWFIQMRECYVKMNSHPGIDASYTSLMPQMMKRVTGILYSSPQDVDWIPADLRPLRMKLIFNGRSSDGDSILDI